mmetsp:Transcript_10978/g.22993  ORF Transcript_10978/g.22993 Transcript_10978/m.22993 type:complete len:210 (+) Transcript_10978:181-810(+)
MIPAASPQTPPQFQPQPSSQRRKRKLQLLLQIIINPAPLRRRLRKYPPHLCLVRHRIRLVHLKQAQKAPVHRLVLRLVRLQRQSLQHHRQNLRHGHVPGTRHDHARHRRRRIVHRRGCRIAPCSVNAEQGTDRLQQLGVLRRRSLPQSLAADSRAERSIAPHIVIRIGKARKSRREEHPRPVITDALPSKLLGQFAQASHRHGSVPWRP